MIKINLNIGDIVLAGKWKNKKVVVKSIEEDEFGSPTVNGKSILKIRIPKLYQKENTMKNIKLKNLLKEGFLSPLDLDKIQDKMGYIKAYGKYWEIIRIYPNQKRKEVTFEGPAGLEICGFNSLSPTTETHNGKPVWRKDV